jgi:hypothetical protein
MCVAWRFLVVSKLAVSAAICWLSHHYMERNMRLRPLTYRAEIIAPLLASLAAGECCSVVGTNGVGKSNLVQHLLRPDVAKHHLGEQAEMLRFIVIDTNMLAEWGGWGFFEGLIAEILSNPGISVAEETATQLHADHNQVLSAVGHYALALRQSTRLLDILCSHSRIVLLFDEFDPLFAQLPSQVLRNLRGLRDRYKYRLMYLTFSRQPLASLRDDADWDEIEPFIELLMLRELGLRPLRDEDAAAEVLRFAERHRQTLAPDVQTKIVMLSGGHPALLRALAQQALLADIPAISESKLLLRLPTIRLECAKIWQQLTGEELDGMLRTVRNTSPDGGDMPVLLLKGLLRPQPDGLAIFSPIFEAFLTTMTAPAQDTPEPIIVEDERGIVCYYGRDISTLLSPREHRFLVYLWKHRDRICSVAEVAEAVYLGEKPVYAEQQEDDLDRMRILARRLRRRLARLTPLQPVPLTVYRLHGYRLGIHQDL